jgi:hypothetical protein
MSNPQAFCHFIQGILAMAENEEGGAALTQIQLSLVRAKLRAALEETDEPPATTEHLFGGDSQARC